MVTPVIARNHTGHRIGEKHQRAILSDKQVAWMRALNNLGWGYQTLAWLFSCGVSTARDICTYRTRWSA